LPIDRTRERNNYRSALISFESQIRSLSLTLDNYADRTSRGLRTITSTRLNHVSRQAALAVAKRRVEMNELLYKAGRVQVREVRDAQDSLVAAANTLTDNLVTYLSARLQLAVTLGVLDVDQEAFWLKDSLASYAQGRPPAAAVLDLPQDEIVPPHRFLEPAQ
jgi:outer membrane protein TolC